MLLYSKDNPCWCSSTCTRAPLKCFFAVKTRHTSTCTLQPVQELIRSVVLQLRLDIPLLVLFNLYMSSSEVLLYCKGKIYSYYCSSICTRALLKCVLQLRLDIPLLVFSLYMSSSEVLLYCKGKIYSYWYSSTCNRVPLKLFLQFRQ